MAKSTTVTTVSPEQWQKALKDCRAYLDGLRAYLTGTTPLPDPTGIIAARFHGGSVEARALEPGEMRRQLGDRPAITIKVMHPKTGPHTRYFAPQAVPCLRLAEMAQAHLCFGPSKYGHYTHVLLRGTSSREQHQVSRFISDPDALSDTRPVLPKSQHGYRFYLRDLLRNTSKRMVRAIGHKTRSTSRVREDAIRFLVRLYAEHLELGVLPQDSLTTPEYETLLRESITLADAVTVKQTQAHLKQAARDADAIAQHGSIEEAAASGHVFKGDDLIPWQKIITAEATRAWVGQVMDEQRRMISGPISDARVDAMVAQRARLFNEDPEILKGLIKQSGDDARGTTATMETGYLLANSAFKETYELGQRISVGNYAGFEGRDAALAALRGRLQTAVEMTAAAKAMSSAAGRSLRRMRGEFSAERMAGLQAINVEGLDPEALAKVIASTGGDPALLAKVGQPTVLRQITDWVGGVYAANLMWGWSTQTINAITSAAQLYLRPLEVILGSGPLQAIGKLRGDETMKAAAVAVRTQARREMVTDVSVLSDGLSAAKWAFLNGDSKIAPHNIEAMNVEARSGAAPIIWREVKGMDDVIANALMASNTALHGSLRLAGVVDEMLKVIRYRAIVSAKASIEADAMPRLRAGSQEYRDFIKSRVEGSFDEAGRAIDVDALAEAKSSTYQQDLIKTGTDDTWTGGASFGAAYQSFAANYPLLRLITPFIKTPSNLIRYGVKLTPGLNLLQKEYVNAVRGLKGDEEQARAIGQMMMGIMLASTAVQLRMDGRITGAGPQNEEQNKQWRSDGNMPYAISGNGEEGKRWFFQLNRFDPIQAPVTLAADIADIYMRGGLSESDEHGLAMSLVLAMSHQFKNKMYLKSLADFITAMGDEKKLETFPTRYIPGLVPWSTLFQQMDTDTHMHEVRTVVDSIKSKLPGYADDVPVRHDWLGEEVKVPGKFYTEQKNTGPLSRAMDEMYAVTGTYLQAPNPRQGTEKMDLRDLTLESGQNAYERFSTLSGKPDPRGPTLKDALTKLVAMPEYQALPHGRGTEDNTKEFAVNKIVEDYRRRGLETLKAEDKTFRDAMGKRAQDVFNAAVTGKKDLRAVAGQASANSLSGLLQAYGVSVPTTPPNLP